jgi:hypothetical protein
MFYNVPEYGRCVVNTAPNDLSLLRRGTIKVIPDNMAGSVRVGSKCFPRQLELEEKFAFRDALTLQSRNVRGAHFLEPLNTFWTADQARSTLLSDPAKCSDRISTSIMPRLLL